MLNYNDEKYWDSKIVHRKETTKQKHVDLDF